MSHTASCTRIILLYKPKNYKNTVTKSARKRKQTSDGEFQCKTCDRSFPTFQALGGHRTGHKRKKIQTDNQSDTDTDQKKTVHQCNVCGLNFQTGQALGGHMRRHRGEKFGFDLNVPLPSFEECGVQFGNILGIRKNNSSIRLLELFV
ncbi:hypothetical protein LUZ60_015321 [Juncus effusus]|nr:hypothetical protein LUZ60_015321 [Juncus effusus]